MNHRIDAKPESEWLPARGPSAHKFGQPIKDKLNAEIKSGSTYPASNDKNAVVMLYVAKRDQPNQPRVVTECRLSNLAIYKKQTCYRRPIYSQINS